MAANRASRKTFRTIDLRSLSPAKRRELALAALEPRVSGAEIARVVGCDPSLPRHVIAGRRLGQRKGEGAGDQARRVMEYIAELLGQSVEELWPELEELRRAAVGV